MIDREGYISHETLDLASKTVLVTGASKGIGAVIAGRIGAAGAHVVLHYAQDRDGAEAAARAIPTERKHFVQGDFARPEVADRVWNEALAWRECIDVLINNAAIVLWNGGIDESDETWDAVWAQTLQVNVLAPAQLMRRAVQHFREHDGSASRRAAGSPPGGVIVTISSWVVHRGVGNPSTMAYGASKAAIRSMTQSVARHYARSNVLAYVIAPGVVDTQMSQQFAETQSGGRAAIENTLAMGEWVPPDEVAELAAFLATGSVRHLSGATLDVNGASHIR
jgi:NAD(P)-dependent dehydrogenase (short-subunit alcohol dehydrogenase family)